MKPWESYLAGHTDAALADLVDFLRIPSISSLKEHLPDVEQAAELDGRAPAHGPASRTCRSMPTAGPPGRLRRLAPCAGQADGADLRALRRAAGRPARPVDQPAVRAHGPRRPGLCPGRRRRQRQHADPDPGRRGVPEDRGKLPVNLKFIFEGQEEIGSPQFVPFVAEHKELLAADLVISADGGQESEDQPVLLVGLKGLVPLQIDVYGANTDLHSGVHGGAVANPVHALVRILDSLRSPDGKIAAPGFFDDVLDLTDEERRQIAAVPFDEQQYFADLGVTRGLRRAGLYGTGARLGPAHAGDQRYLGRVPGRGREDRAAERGPRQDHVPARRQPGPGPRVPGDRGARAAGRGRADAGRPGRGDPAARAGLSLPDARRSPCQPAGRRGAHLALRQPAALRPHGRQRARPRGLPAARWACTLSPLRLRWKTSGTTRRMSSSACRASRRASRRSARSGRRSPNAGWNRHPPRGAGQRGMK